MDNLKIGACTMMVVVMMTRSAMMQRFDIVAVMIVLMIMGAMPVMFMSVLVECLLRFFIPAHQPEAKRPDRAALAF
jgi:hypothetical protein